MSSSCDVILDGSLNSSSPRRMRVKAAFKRFNQMRLAHTETSPRHCIIAAAAAAAASSSSAAIVPVTAPQRLVDVRVASVSSAGSLSSSSSEALFLRKESLESSLSSSAGNESLRLRKQNTKRLSLLLKEMVFIDGRGGNHERFIEEESINLRVMRDDPQWNLFA